MTGQALPDSQSGPPSKESTASYWHRDPAEGLVGHRTTEKLPAKADVVIVGSGITGAFAAWFLRGGGRERGVVLLEGREVCWGATGRNGGHCQPNIYGTPPEIASFEVETYHYLRDLVAENSIPCDWVSTTGVHALYTPNLVERAANNLALIRKTHPHLADAAYLVTRDAHPDDPSLPSLADLKVPDAHGAVVQKHAAGLWPYKLVAWVLEELLKGNGEGDKGFNLQTKTVVSKVQRVDDSWIVHTDRGQIAAEKVLLACNGYVSSVLPEFTGLITPVQGQIASLLPGETRLGHTYVFLAEPATGPVIDDYLIQAQGGKKELVLGGGRVLGKGKGRGVSDDDFIDGTVSHHLRTMLPTVLDMPVNGRGREMDASFEWSGIMGYSVDGRPWVGEVPESLGGGPGIYISAGYTGHGMPVGALAARAVVSMMEGKKRDPIPRAYMITKERIERVRNPTGLKGEMLDDIVMDDIGLEVKDYGEEAIDYTF